MIVATAGPPSKEAGGRRELQSTSSVQNRVAPDPPLSGPRQRQEVSARTSCGFATCDRQAIGATCGTLTDNAE